MLILISETDQVQLLIRNARQILGVAAAAFGKELFDINAGIDPCSDGKNDAHRLACDWRSINNQLASISSYEEVSPEWIDEVTEVSGVALSSNSTGCYLLTVSSGFGPRRTS